MSAPLAVCGLAFGVSGPAAAAAPPSVRSDHGCYLVGAPVWLTGAGFAPSRPYVVSIDGVYFGEAGTDPGGAFTTALQPGGLGAGVAQAVDQLTASDGTATAATAFTVTRATGARFVTGRRSTTRLPLEVWGFGLDGRHRKVYVHYVAHDGRLHKTVAIGTTGGECGYVKTRPRAIFPFTPSIGTWTLQLDASRSYARKPSGPVARIRVRIG